MYEEKKSRIPFRDIALQLLIIVLFILILLWLFPTKKNMKKYVDKNNNNNSTEYNNNESNNNSNSNANNNNSNTNNNGNNNNNNSNTNNNDNSNSNDGATTAKQYEYSKTSEGTYGEYGTWSDWSTNYVAASNTVDVQTEVRSGVTGYKTNVVQTGTQTDKNVVVGTKTNKNVLTGYKVKYLRDIKTTFVLKNVDDYIYVFKSGQKSYQCADGKKGTLYKTTPASALVGRELTYEYLITFNDSTINIPTGCNTTSEEYTYALYERIPVYKTETEDVYGNVTYPVYTEKTEAIYGNVTYYRYRTRSYQAGTESIKWSNSNNDQSLIAQGYHFTGNVK